MELDTINLAPDFIKFLFSSKPKFDCYFQVGNVSQGKPERIGAVKLMLMAHSEVFRLELEDSELKDKENVPIPDIHPDTFKGMLKYVYGHDTTPDMSFDEADNLLYVAEKYMMKTLKDKLATRLMELLNPDNICSLLNNKAVYTHLQFDTAITDILRYETDKVLASPQFPWMNSDGFLKILQQDGLAVAEIELWRAAIKWAKHRANTEDGQHLRGQLCGLMQHLRICTLTPDEITTDVLTSDVLTDNEIVSVMKSLARKEKPQDPCEFSDEIRPREIMLKKNKQINELVVMSGFYSGYFISSRIYKMILVTKQRSIELLPLICKSKSQGNSKPKNSTYQVFCKATVTKDAVLHNSGSSSTNGDRSTGVSNMAVQYGGEFEMPLGVDGRNITLQPNTVYYIEIKVDGEHFVNGIQGRRCFSNDHLVLLILHDDIGCISFPSDKLRYTIVS